MAVLCNFHVCLPSGIRSPKDTNTSRAHSCSCDRLPGVSKTSFPSLVRCLFCSTQTPHCSPLNYGAKLNPAPPHSSLPSQPCRMPASTFTCTSSRSSPLSSTLSSSHPSVLSPDCCNRNNDRDIRRAARLTIRAFEKFDPFRIFSLPFDPLLPLSLPSGLIACLRQDSKVDKLHVPTRFQASGRHRKADDETNLKIHKPNKQAYFQQFGSRVKLLS